MGDIYGVIRKDINKIVYIGQTIRTYKVRWQQHKQTAKNVDSSRYALYAAIQKFGIDNFEPILIEQCDNALLNEREKYWIKFYNTIVDKGGYNLTEGGDSNSIRQRIKVYRYSLDGQYIDSFNSVADAGYLLNISAANIGTALHNKKHYAGGFLWSSIKVDCMPKYISRNRPIIQLTKDGKYIQTFSSARQAALYLNKNHGEANIHNVAKGRRKTAYGYQWQYKKEGEVSKVD